MCDCGTDHYGKGLLTPEVSRPFWYQNRSKMRLGMRVKEKYFGKNDSVCDLFRIFATELQILTIK